MDGVFTEKEQIHRIDNQGDKITTSKHKTTYIWKSSTLLYFTRGFLLSEATFQILSLWGMRNKTVSGRGHAAAAQMINCADCSFFKSLIMLRQHERHKTPCGLSEMKIYTYVHIWMFRSTLSWYLTRVKHVRLPAKIYPFFGGLSIPLLFVCLCSFLWCVVIEVWFMAETCYWMSETPQVLRRHLGGLHASLHSLFICVS